MKKVLVGISVVAMLVAGIIVGTFMSKDDVVGQDVSEMVQELRDRSNGSKYQVFKVEGTDMTHIDYFNQIPYNDDFSFSAYEISAVIDNEIYGNAIQSLDSTFVDGGRLYLDGNELDVDLGEGDKVMVIFENGYDDAIVDVVKLDDGRMTSVDVVEKHGFMVVDKPEVDENHTTIAVEITDGGEHGFEMAKGEVVAQNIFDNTDFVVLTPEEAEGLKMGGVYLITFNHDYIDSIVENDLAIGGKVFGQIIGEEI